MVYGKGDVVLVPIPFRDQTAAKVRPALVVSGRTYNAGGDVIVAAITLHPPRYRPGRIPLADLHAVDTGLRQALDL